MAAARGEQPAAVLAWQRHLVPVELAVGFARRLQQLTDEVQRSLVTFCVYQISAERKIETECVLYIVYIGK